jgi:hypothetical protein
MDDFGVFWFDITRPQTAFEVRGLDQISSNDTGKTNKADCSCG